ncbi:MAG: UDP-N-acetylmuramoyl-L-alanyl-D-glutamate--2,6-diaminopimelate ligase [Gammaproteobacteria bacterium]|nr:UDP-N-acetylmuramoyl-L-alanyl-D-glutamate--2,6-diaminopimelate ligase [Gammaproteobacteria bacterium]
MCALKQTDSLLLSELLQGIVTVPTEMDRVVQQLVLDSRKVQHGDVFLACTGQHADGRHYIDQAITQGAAAVLWDSDRTTLSIALSWRASPGGARVPCIAINNLTQLVGTFADRLYNGPSKSMYMVGVTGTNGKTSTTQFIAQALADNDHCGVIGTLGWGFPGALQVSQHTTPDGITTQHWLAQLRAQGAKVVAMEVSSHALDQARINGVSIDCAVFTNLTHDHLDYHKNFASYARAKQKLFHWPGLRQAVINTDDPQGRIFHQALKPDVAVLTYGMNAQSQRPDLFADMVELSSHGIAFRVCSVYGEDRLRLPLYGKFNVSNVLATLGVLLHHKLPWSAALTALTQLQPVAGRMQLLRSPRHATVVVDYAHTPDALLQALTSLRGHAQGKLWCVFGCGGDRDTIKRPLMGSIAQTYADKVVITSDNPRHEDPLQIIQQIQAGLTASKAALIESDRRLAIRQVLALASPQDLVLIAGKGHETYQQIGDQKLPFSDVAVVNQVFHQAG